MAVHVHVKCSIFAWFRTLILVNLLPIHTNCITNFSKHVYTYTKNSLPWQVIALFIETLKIGSKPHTVFTTCHFQFSQIEHLFIVFLEVFMRYNAPVTSPSIMISSFMAMCVTDDMPFTWNNRNVKPTKACETVWPKVFQGKGMKKKTQ